MTYYYGHFTLAEGVPAGDGSWGSPGDVAAEEGMGSKPAECPLSPEKAVMACSLAETLGLPERINTLGVWVADSGRGGTGRGGCGIPAPTDQGADSSPLPL